MKVKLVLIITAIILCTFALIITISAYEKEPNLSPVAADVNIVPLGPSAPVVLTFANAIGVLSGPYTPVQGGLALTYMSVLVEDLNGNQELPGTVAYPIALNTPTSANMIAGMAAPLTAPNPAMTRTASGCQAVDCSAALVPPAVGSIGIACTPGRETLQRIYLCNTPLLQTDPPGNWRFSIGITDSTGLTSNAPLSGDPGFSQHVIYNTLSAPFFGTFPTPQNFLWNSLSSTGTNQISAAGLVITNLGNVPSNTMTITGTDLTGVNIPSSVLNKNAFTLSTSNGGTPPSECVPGANTIILSGTSQTIPGASLPYTQITSTSNGALTDTEVIYACIRNTPISSITGTLDTQYKTPVGQDWNLVV